MRKQNGFTLIELMIVVVIVSIIIAFAYPSYRDSVLKSRRTEAQAGLLACLALQERWFTRNTSYANSASVASNSNLFGTKCSSTDNGYYNIGITVGGAATVNSVTRYSTLTLTATPTTKGGQNDDTTCASLTLTQAGTKGATDSGSNTTTSECWKK